MSGSKNNTNTYFQDALSDFVHDAASGRAIRHLVDIGFTTAQIMNELDYPTPFEKVQQTVTRYLKETGILLEALPEAPENLHIVQLGDMPQAKLFSLLAQLTASNGEDNSYVSCPFGITRSQTENRMIQSLSMLTMREREYLNGIDWGEKLMYHRLNRRMLEIGVQIALCTEEIRFFFLKSGEVLNMVQGKDK